MKAFGKNGSPVMILRPGGVNPASGTETLDNIETGLDIRPICM